NIAHLTATDNAADDRRLPVIIGSNHCSAPIVQFQRRISQRIGNPKLRELRANSTNDHSLWTCALNNETANHHVVARLNKAAGADVTQSWRTCLRLSQIVANNIEIDAFGRCRRNVGILHGTAKSILHVWVGLRALLTEPVAEISVRILIEIHYVVHATINREIPRAGTTDVSVSRRRPTEQVLRTKVVAISAKARTETDRLINFVFD